MQGQRIDRPPLSWSVVVPVKRLARAKTRLQPPARVARAQLALAMALDTVQAAMACEAVGEVVVVCDDDEAIHALRRLGAQVVGDEPDAGLNPALRHGIGHVRRTRPESGVALLSSDLPALRPHDLSAALSAAAAYNVSVVADVAGTGTVLLTAAAGVEVHPAFGPASLMSHLAAGAVALSAPLPGLRRDVDTAADLAEARALGLGPHTTAVLAGG